MTKLPCERETMDRVETLSLENLLIGRSLEPFLYTKFSCFPPSHFSHSTSLTILTDSPAFFCSSLALSTSSCGLETVGLCSKRPRGTDKARTRARAPARRVQQNREQWRSSKQPSSAHSPNWTAPFVSSRTFLLLLFLPLRLLQLPSVILDFEI